MYLTPTYIRNHKVTLALVLFLVIMTAVHLAQPVFAYNKDGSYRTFGIGYRNKTIVPVWAITIIVAILCYLAVLQSTS